MGAISPLMGSVFIPGWREYVNGDTTFEKHAVHSVIQGLPHTFRSCQAQGPYYPHPPTSNVPPKETDGKLEAAEQFTCSTDY